MNKKNKLLLKVALIIIILCIITIIIYCLYKKEKFEGEENYEEEILLKEPLNDIHTIDINTSNDLSIPKNIYLTWETSMNEMPPKMKESIELLKNVNNDCNVYIFDKDQRVNFIKKYFKTEILDAYNSLVPGAFKADVWRYCILYKYGGIYQDIKMQPINGFKYSELLVNNKEYYVKDIDGSGRGIYNAVLICKPNNKVLLKTINNIIYNVKNKYYGESSLYPTGPMLMKKFFTEKEINDMEMQLAVEYDSENNDIHIVKFNDRQILKMYDGYRKDQKNLGMKPHHHMWANKEIYK
jgi:mannosyltransferase OCH1-like enzyme